MDLHTIPDQPGAAFPPQMDLTPVIESMRAHLEMIAAMAGAPVQPITITDEQRHMAAVRREMNRPGPRMRIDIDELTAAAVAAERERIAVMLESRCTCFALTNPEHSHDCGISARDAAKLVREAAQTDG